MKAKIKIFKTCSLGTMIFEKQKNPFQKAFENKVQFDRSKVHNYHLVRFLRKKFHTSFHS
jgi:hypothetical protein